MEYDGKVVIGIDGDASGLVSALNAVNDAIRTEFAAASVLLRTAGAGLTEAASVGIMSRLDTAKAAGERVTQAVSTGIEGSKGKISAAAQKAVKDAAASSVDTESWRSVGRNMIYGIEDGIRSVSYRLGVAAASAASSALAAAKAALGIASPSKRAEEEIGVQIPRGIANGILRDMPEISGALESGLDDVLGRVRAGIMGQNRLVSATAPAGFFGTAEAERSDGRGSSGGTTVIEFTGSLAQLGRVLEPVIRNESSRLGADLVTE